MNFANNRAKASQTQLIAVLIFVLILALGWLFVKPELAKRKEAKAALDLKTTELSEKQGLVSGVTKLISDYEANKARLAIIKEAIPAAPKVPNLLASIEKIVQSVGMSISEFQITEEEEQVVIPAQNEAGVPVAPAIPLVAIPELVSLKIDLTVGGSPESFIALIPEIERNLRPLDITLINIETDDDDIPNSYEFVINTYYQKQ